MYKNVMLASTKPTSQSPAGRLRPLRIPTRPWESIGMDFLGPLPKSTKGNDMILIIVDRLTKMAKFIPTQSTVMSTQALDLFLQDVYRNHRLLANIGSYSDPR